MLRSIQKHSVFVRPFAERRTRPSIGASTSRSFSQRPSDIGLRLLPCIAPPISGLLSRIFASCSSDQRFATFLQFRNHPGHPCRSASTSPCRVCRKLHLRVRSTGARQSAGCQGPAHPMTNDAYQVSATSATTRSAPSGPMGGSLRLPCCFLLFGADRRRSSSVHGNTLETGAGPRGTPPGPFSNVVNTASVWPTPGRVQSHTPFGNTAASRACWPALKNAPL